MPSRRGDTPVVELAPDRYDVQLSVGSGDVLALAFAYLHKMSERGIPLPFRVPQTVAFEHHFPRAWYHMEAVETNANQAARKRGAPPSSNAQQALGEHGVADPSASSGSRPLDLNATPEGGPPSDSSEPPIRSQPFTLEKKPPRACGSKAVVTAFADRRASRRLGGDFSETLHHHSTADQSGTGGGDKGADGLLCGELIARDPDTGAVRTEYLDEAALWDALVSTPEQCIVSKFLPPDQGHNDQLYARFTPTVFTVERRVNAHSERDVRLPLARRGDTLAPDCSRETACPPMLSSAAREALQKLVWFIEAVENRAVLMLSAVLKYRKGQVWFLRAEAIEVSSRPPVDRTPHFGRISVQHAPGAPARPVTGVSMTSDEAVAIWDAVEKATLEQQATSADGSSVARGARAGVRRSTTRGMWPSFCEFKPPADDVIAAANRRYFELTAKSKHGGAAAAAAMHQPPHALRRHGEHDGADDDSEHFLVCLGPRSAADEGDGAVPMTMMTEAELAGVWGSFDAEVERCVGRATATAAPNAALAEPIHEASSGPRRDARATSVSSAHSSANSVISSLARTTARRQVSGPSRARRRIAQLHAMAHDTQPHLRAIEREQNGGGKSGGHSQGRANSSGARTHGGSQPASQPAPTATDGSAAVPPPSPRTSAMEDVLYEAYQAILARPRDFEARTLGLKEPPLAETTAPWRTLRLAEGEGAPTWSEAFTPSQLAAHGFRLDQQHPEQLHCGAQEAQEAVRSISALMHLHRVA